MFVCVELDMRRPETGLDVFFVFRQVFGRSDC